MSLTFAVGCLPRQAEVLPISPFMTRQTTAQTAKSRGPKPSQAGRLESTQKRRSTRNPPTETPAHVAFPLIAVFQFSHLHGISLFVAFGTHACCHTRDTRHGSSPVTDAAESSGGTVEHGPRTARHKKGGRPRLFAACRAARAVALAPALEGRESGDGARSCAARGGFALACRL